MKFLTLAELTTRYNLALETLGKKQIKKFSCSKELAISKIVAAEKAVKALMVTIDKCVDKAFEAETLVEKKVQTEPSLKPAEIHKLQKFAMITLAGSLKAKNGSVLNTIIECLTVSETEVNVINLIEHIVDWHEAKPNAKEMTTAYAAEYIKYYIKSGKLEITEL